MLWKMSKRKEIIEIFLAGLEGVNPKRLIHKQVELEDGMLRFGAEVQINLTDIRNIYVIGFGKASVNMAQALEDILGEHIKKGHIITKYGHGFPLKYLEVTEAGHPMPDKNGLLGTKEIVSIVKEATKGDLVICLISGGGSALLTDLPEGATIHDLIKLNTLLLKSGASIEEVNCVRKHLSQIKGGGLSKEAYPAKMVCLILSDVIGDSTGIIASGPTTYDSTTYNDSMSILKKYKIDTEIPLSLYKSLIRGMQGKSEETLKASNPIFFQTTNLVIGNNLMALESAKKKAEAIGYNTIIVKSDLTMNVVEVADFLIRKLNQYNRKNTRKTCLLFGGEPTVQVKGNGLGGRNQHLALIMSVLLKDNSNVTMLSGGTDGTDGPTDAAGAVVDCSTVVHAAQLDLDVYEWISRVK